MWRTLLYRFQADARQGSERARISGTMKAAFSLHSPPRSTIRMRFPNPLKDLLPVETIKQLSQLVSQPTLVQAMKEAAQKIGLKDPFQSGNIQQILQQAGRWMESAADPWMRHSAPGLMPGVNATGELFSSRWCTHRLCPEAIAQRNHIESRYAETTKLDQKLRNLLIGLTSAPAVFLAPSMPMALYLVAIANNVAKQPKQWILPRVDCIRLPQAGSMQGGNVRSILDQANASVLEIGTNHDCTSIDFEENMRGNDHQLLLASLNSLPAEMRSEHRQRAIAATKPTNGSIVEILMDGSLHDLSSVGLHSQVISNRWDQGVDFLVVPGDALLGGPECGILLGKQEAMESVLRIADSLGLNANSVTKAGLLRTLESSESLEQWKQLPIGASLSTSIENLKNRADRMATQLSASPTFERVAVANKPCRIGAGVWSSLRMPSCTIQLFPKSSTPSALAEQFAAGEVPIWANVQSDHLELVMRSIEPDDDRMIVKQLCPE